MSELNGIRIKPNKLRFVSSGLKLIVIFPQPPKMTGVSHHLHLETLKALCRLGVSMPLPPLKLYRGGIEARVRILKARLGQNYPAPLWQEAGDICPEALGSQQTEPLTHPDSGVLTVSTPRVHSRFSGPLSATEVCSENAREMRLYHPGGSLGPRVGPE